MLSQLPVSIRRTVLLAMLLCAPEAWAISVSPSPSYNGSYTVSWNSAGLGCWYEDIPPYYPTHCYALQENGVDIASSGGIYSQWFSGKAPGSYEYQVIYRLTVAGTPWDEYAVDGPVSVMVHPATPGTPSGPTGTEYTGAYTISWSAQTGATSYRLEEQLNSGGWSEIHAAAGTSKAVSGKTPGSWEYRVRACVWSTGCSTYSSTKTVTVSAPATPGTPSGPNDDYDGAYTISWSGQTGATNYTLEERVNAGSWSSIHSGSATSKDVSGRSAGTWDYRVRAESGAGNSNFSSTKSVVVTLPPSSAPGTPSGPTGTEYSGAYTISWSTVGAATSYRLEERFNSGSWSEIHNDAAASKGVSGKTPGSWDYQVRACNVAGCTGYSSVKTVTVDAPTTPGTPSGPSGTEYSGAYTISWSAVGGAASYRLEEQFNGGSWSEIHNDAAASKAVSGKTPGSWSYRLRACSGAGCSGYSSTKTVTVDTPTTPGTPSGPGGTEYSGAYTIEWSAVGGAASYRLEEQFNGGSWSEIHNDAAASKAVSGKTPGSWTYRLRACSGAGCGGYSATATVTVAAPAAPGTPSGPGFDYDGSYTISWSSATGAATYTLQERVDSGSWSTIHDAAGTSKNVVATAEGKRDYQVRACSGAGCSGYSAVATVAVALPPVATGSTPPGAIPAGFSVGTQGDASYSIPINVPAGTGGLKPSLALSYNHLAGNGLAGMRWTLSGISSIARCSQTFAQDGVTDAYLERLCLNGQRLVNLTSTGAYHAAGTEYRTEIESFQRIKQVGSGTTAYFYVDHGNGLRSYFGETSNARLPSSGFARTWYISRTVDQFGNEIEYEYYSPSASETLPETITWTRNDGESLPPRYAVTIAYENRPADDQRSGYTAFGAWARTKRIDEIEVTYDDGSSVQEIATYALTYDAPAAPNGTGRSRLTGVSVCRASECLPQTLFTVPEALSGWNTGNSTGRPISATPLVGDWNGDGRMDLFQAFSNQWYVYTGDTGGLLDAGIATGLSAATQPAKARVFDFNGDGLADLLYQDGSANWKVAPSNGTTGFGTSIDTGVSTSTVANPLLQDHDGDGLADMVAVIGTGIGWLRNEGGSFEWGTQLFSPETAVSVPDFSVGTVDSTLRSLDANGDGRADLIVEVVDTLCNPNDPEDCFDENDYYVLYADGNTYYPALLADGLAATSHYTNFRFGDFDGDGMSDLLYLNESGTAWVLRISSGVGTASGLPVTNASKVLIADYDGDGRDDFIRPDGHYWYIHRSSGTGLPASYTDSVYSPNAGSASAFIADFRGAGRPQIVRTDTSYWLVHQAKSELADVVTEFTDGLGRTIEVEYESLARTEAYTLNLGHAPSDDYVRRFGGARYVVTTETHDDGVGGTRDIEHEYDTAFVNTAGRGWQSFKSHTVTDTVQGTRSITEYDQAFPTAGMPVLIEQKTVSGDKLIRSVASDVDFDALTGSALARQFVRVESTTTLEYEVFGDEDGELLRTIVENPVYDSTYGYVTQTTRTVKTGASGPQWVTATAFDRGVEDGAGQWCLGLPGTVVTSSTLPGGSPVTRTVDYAFNSDCSLDTLTDLSEGSTGKQLVREFAYDDFGNVEAVSEYSVAGGSGTARTTAFAFDADGQFPETVTIGGVNLTTTLAFDPLLGVRTEVTGPDGLTTSYEYDAFGRLTLEERPAGSTELTYRTCSTCFAPNAAFYIQAEDSTGATSFTFFDALERPVASDTPLAGGYRSRERTVYQATGRVHQRSLPYVAGESVHWLTTTYDAIGRPLTEDDEETGTTAAYEYLGHALEVTDGNSHTTRYEHNALGQIQKVVDALGGETEYTYHPFGELHTVTDDDSNVTTILNDARGFKTQMNDPDMGEWTYDHNAFGELIEQTDAKSQTVTLEYDAAGRLEARYEPEGTTSFAFYPHNASAGQAGRLYQVTSPGGLVETYEYHATHGAVTEIVREIGAASYELDFAFDAHGRMTQITYPLNVDSERLAVEYVFDGWGALSQVRNATTSHVYYTLNAQNGSGAVRRETFGNGVVDQYGFQATTGRLASIQSGPSGSATLQNLAFEWDLAGNLEQRVDQRLSRTEVFDYDALDRLETVTRNSTPIFNATYDALGNLETKTGVSGTYVYGGSRPHAVTATGSMSFAYDANGNMTDRDETEITWASYNLPTRIERSSGEYSEFLYGADRSRYRQIEGSGVLQSTRHYASPGLFEVLIWNSGASRVDYHYIHANGRAVAQFTTSNVEDDELQYLHRDHQGSVVATTATNGTVLDRFEYDAFGVRSTPVGSTERMHRGYTGHEHLEALDLIHMNGRVQDPLLGKFLSPDPFVQAPYHSQSLNRYSYVWNNPLSLVDPSGFQGKCAADNYCGDPCRFDSNSPWCTDPCANGPYQGRGDCITLDEYREREQWDQRTQALKDPSYSTVTTVTVGATSVAGVIVQTERILTSPGVWSEVDDAAKQLGKRLAVRIPGIGILYGLAIPGQLGSGECIGNPSCEAWMAAEMSKGQSVDSTAGAMDVNGVANNPDPNNDDDGNEPTERHHDLPREFRPQFERAGLDIEKYTVQISRSAHRLKPGGLHTGPQNWNAQWREFFRANPNATRDQILNQLDRMRAVRGR